MSLSPTLHYETGKKSSSSQLDDESNECSLRANKVLEDLTISSYKAQNQHELASTSFISKTGKELMTSLAADLSTKQKTVGLRVETRQRVGSLD